MKNNRAKTTSFQEDLFPRVAHHGHKKTYASTTEGASCLKLARVPKKCMMNYSVFRAGLLYACFSPPSVPLPCNCHLVHFLKFPACRRQSIPSPPKGQADEAMDSIQPALKACGNRCQQSMAARRLQQTRKGNADDLQPDVSFSSGIHGRKAEGMRKNEGVHDEGQIWKKKSLDKRRGEINPPKKQYAFNQKIWTLGQGLTDLGHSRAVTWARKVTTQGTNVAFKKTLREKKKRKRMVSQHKYSCQHKAADNWGT